MTIKDQTTRFSNRVKDYIKYRPSYPKELVSFIFSEFQLNENSVIADMGSGTGIFTQLLLEKGATVFGVEPNEGMRGAAEDLLQNYAKFKSVAAPAEKTGLTDGSVDFICAATSFHWFDVKLVKAEWMRLLKPGGSVFLVWNVRRDDTPFMSEYETMLHTYGVNYTEAKLKDTNEGGTGDFFSPEIPKVKSIPNGQNIDFESLVGRLLSSSYAPLVGHPQHEPMLKELKRIFTKHQVNGAVPFEYTVKAYYAPLRRG